MCTKLAMDGSSHRLAAVGFQARARAIQNWRREWPVVGKQSTLLERVGARGRPGNGNGAAHGSAGSAQWHNAGHGKPAPDIPKSTTPPGAHHGRRTLPAVQASMYLSPQWNALAAHLAGQTDCSFLCTQGLVSSSRVRKLEDGDDASAVATAFRCEPYPGFLAKEREREEWRIGLGSGASRRCRTARSRDVTLHAHLTPLPLL